MDEKNSDPDLHHETSDQELDLAHQVESAFDAEMWDEVFTLTSNLHPADMADIIQQFPAQKRLRLVELLHTTITGEALSFLEESVREQILPLFTSAEVAAAIHELESDDAALILEDLQEDMQREVLEALPLEERISFEKTRSYPEYSAGRLMQREVVLCNPQWTLGQVIDSLEDIEHLPEHFYDVYVVDEDNIPVGEIPLSWILRHPRRTPVAKIMNSDVRSVPINLDQEEVAYIFQRYSLSSMPVVDQDGRIAGMITVDDIIDVIQEEASDDILKLGGVTQETSLYGNILQASLSRFGWLFISLINCLIASFVIAHFEQALESFIVLAFLMPIVASMGGNAGMQTLTVTVRSLSIYNLRAGHVVSAIKRELSIAALNGLGLALILSSVTLLWTGNLKIGIIIGLALLFNVLWSGFAGAFIPYILHRINLDPAISAGPIMSTTTDVMGFALFLGLATLILL
ncbi:MAG: magnesium transporter [Candidatus Paracaedibacteraceae bacterium]|nr:magnesium transporter [Candidatus Paracaedibacteraceae bacterium]